MCAKAMFRFITFIILITASSAICAEMEKVYKFIDSGGAVIGELYVEWKQNKTFINAEIRSNSRAVYKIDRHTFEGINGIDWQHNHTPFSNYVFTAINSDEIYIAFANSEGRAVSDSLWVRWKEGCGCFEREVPP